jgi:D-alanyl-lipoteichoic acid acyltransferase DltB (MBOAT superfamily)
LGIVFLLDSHCLGHPYSQQRTPLDLSGFLMTLPLILISIIVAVLLGIIMHDRDRSQLLLGISVIAVFAFQPELPVRGLDFWLPLGTLGLTTLTWMITTPLENRSWKINWPTLTIMVGMVMALGLTRYLGLSSGLTASRPPQILQILAGLASFSLLGFLLAHFSLPNKMVMTSGLIFIILIFIALKVPLFAQQVSIWVRSMNHQSTNLASPQDFRWLGYSYIAFRLIHTIRDRQGGRLPPVSLAEYITYVIFFPSLTAGPIDRIERFVGDLRSPAKLSADDFGEAGKRIMLGLLKKFVIADSLAMIAMNATNALQVRSAGWAWILLYAFAFQIYFDFSGYTDIAIGLGRLLGIKLPENFNQPYLKPNLTQFWNNWHMTLTQWFRAYYFNPLTRALRAGKKPLSIPIIILFTQLTTMVLIGLWHGVSVNFVAWGLWHGFGLFVHNRWSDLTRSSFLKLPLHWQKGLNVGGTLLTFNFISIGWIFFALPRPSISFHFLQVLFGLV